MTTTGKIVRGILGLIVLIALVVLVNSWWSEYKSAAHPAGSATATATVGAAATATAGQPASGTAAPAQHVVILIEGLNLRDKPDATGKSFRGLKKGEQFVLVGTAGTWLQVRDTNGALGWVTNNPQYIKIVKN